MEARSLDVICHLIQKNRKWSDYVDEIWQEQYRKASNFPFAEELRDSVFNWRYPLQIMRRVTTLSHRMTAGWAFQPAHVPTSLPP